MRIYRLHDSKQSVYVRSEDGYLRVPIADMPALESGETPESAEPVSESEFALGLRMMLIRGCASVARARGMAP